MQNLSKKNKIKPNRTKRECSKEEFYSQLLTTNALANNNIRHKSFDLDNAKEISDDGLNFLLNNNGLKTLIAAQMLSIHALQQKSIIFAQSLDNFEDKKYYINSAIKLSNCLCQQATLLAKLQGLNDQKITVEHVDVHDGGQAIVGSINTKGEQ